MANLLAKTRKITSILQRSVDSLEGDLPYNNMAAQLADIIDCNAAIVNGGGALLGFAMKYKTNNDRVEEFFEAKQLPEEYTRGISRVYDTQENIGIDSDLTIFPVESKDDFPDGLTTIAPIYGGGMRLGSFIIWRNDHDFVDEDLILVEIASTVVGLQLLNLQTENLEETIRKQTAINMAINTLSYSEIKAVSISYMLRSNHQRQIGLKMPKLSCTLKRIKSIKIVSVLKPWIEKEALDKSFLTLLLFREQ